MVLTDTINQLFKLDFSIVITGIFIFLSAIIAFYEVIGKFSKIIKRPVKWVKKKDEDHELLLENAKRIKELEVIHKQDEKKLIKRDNDIENKLEKLTDMVLEKEIGDLRWTILDFSSALSNGRKYNGEAFKHIFSVYEKYEKILDENGMENGLVEESMKYIRDMYQKLLRNGGL